MLACHQVGFFKVLLNRDALILGDHVGFGQRQTGIRVILNNLVVQIVPVQDASLQNQGVLDGVMQDAEAAVFLHEDVVNQVCCLLCGFNVFLGLRNKLKQLVAACKDAQQTRHHRQNGVAHLGHYNLRPAVLLIAKQVSEVVRHRSLPLGSDVAVYICLAVLDGLKDDVAKFLVVHRLVIISRHVAGFAVVRAIRHAIRRDGDEVWVIPAGSDAAGRHVPLFLIYAFSTFQLRTGQSQSPVHGYQPF